MSIKDFQTFISSEPQLQNTPFGPCVRIVNLLHLNDANVPYGFGAMQAALAAAAQRQHPIGRSSVAQIQRMNMVQRGVMSVQPIVVQNRVALVLDAESCLDRLYGGYFPDWSCGGEWRHMYCFLATIFGRMHQSNVHLAVFFNGAIEPTRFKEWIKLQAQNKSRVKQALRHISKRGTPPPKAFWLPPSTLHTMLRLGLRSMNATVLNSIDDHRHEVMSFVWENGYHGVMSDDGEYALFNPPRYFSAHDIKLSLQQHDVTTTEYHIDDVCKNLDLNPNRFCLLATLLGNHIVPVSELTEFHSRLAPEMKQSEGKFKVGFDRVIRAVINYIRALPSIDDYETLGQDIFGDAKDPRISKLRQSVKYYLYGSKEGYVKQRPNQSNNKKKKGKSGVVGSAKKPLGGTIKSVAEEKQEEIRRKQRFAERQARLSKNENATHLVERIALDLDQIDLNEAVEMATNAAVLKHDDSTQFEKDAEKSGGGYQQILADEDDVTSDDDSVGRGGNNQCLENEREAFEEQSDNQTNKNTNDSKNISVVQALASGVEVAASEGGKYPVNEGQRNYPSQSICIPEPPTEIKRTAMERHRQGQMSPLILQLLTRGEIKLPVLMEDCHNFANQGDSKGFTTPADEIPPVHEVYQPLRQRVYAVLYNVHHAHFNKKQIEELLKSNQRKIEEFKKKISQEDISSEEKESVKSKLDHLTKQTEGIQVPSEVEYRVREWLPYNNYENPYVQECIELKWPVPTVQRLWFGSTPEDKQKRLHAFLSCMRCDDNKSLLVQANVPQPMLMLACVLRYLMTVNSPSYPVIRKPELDAFLATALAPELRDQQFLDDLTLDILTLRGVKLGTLFMQGVEMAHFANDACGAPIPLQMCLPWNFFDGKLFHATLLRAAKSRNLLDLCQGRIDIVNQVERMRAAILEGIVAQGPPQPLLSQGFPQQIGFMANFGANHQALLLGMQRSNRNFMSRPNQKLTVKKSKNGDTMVAKKLESESNHNGNTDTQNGRTTT